MSYLWRFQEFWLSWCHPALGPMCAFFGSPDAARGRVKRCQGVLILFGIPSLLVLRGCECHVTSQCHMFDSLNWKLSTFLLSQPWTISFPKLRRNPQKNVGSLTINNRLGRPCLNICSISWVMSHERDHFIKNGDSFSGHPKMEKP